jgi:hypothetical protein
MISSVIARQTSAERDDHSDGFHCPSSFCSCCFLIRFAITGRIGGEISPRTG